MKQKYFILNFFILLGALNGYSQIVNEGILGISPSTDVYFENEYTNKSAATHDCNGNLYLNSNFINNGSTASTSGTTFFKSASNPLINVSGTTERVNFYNLEINITAASAQGVSVADNFIVTVANAINFASGNLRLVGESQLIQSHSGVDVNTVTSGKLLKDQQGYDSAFKYNYWSSPVNNGGTFALQGGKFDGTDSALNPFSPTQILFNSGSPYNGLPSVVDGGGNVTTALTINNSWLYKYTRGDSSYADWISMDENTSLNPGEGYVMKGTNTTAANQNYVFYGAPNNGEYQFPISIGEQTLLGNPYPSALDAEKFINDNILILDALYFWVDGGSNSHTLTDYLGGYAIRNLTGGTTPSIASPLISGIGTSGGVTAPSQYVSVGQGFFVDAYGAGNIVFDNSQRVFKTESAGDTVFYRTSDANTTTAANENQYIRIGHEDPEGFHRQLLLGFLPNSSADINYNLGYDALVTETREDDLFFIIENDLNKKYAIQGVNSYNETMEFPLYLIITETGTQQIMIDAVENFSQTIYLKDKVLNTTHNLTASNFDINLPVGEYLDRYAIVFMPQEALLVDNQQLKNISVFYNGDQAIVVSNKERLQIQSINIFNVLGQEVLKLNSNLNNQSKVLIPFNNSNGIYLVQLDTNKGKLTQKILKY